MKNFRKKGGWVYPGTVKIFWVPPIISGTGKATNFKFCTHIYWLNRNNSQLQISGKVAVGVVRLPKFFRAPVHRAHRAVIFAIAQLSCVVSCRRPKYQFQTDQSGRIPVTHELM